MIVKEEVLEEDDNVKYPHGKLFNKYIKVNHRREDCERRTAERAEKTTYRLGGNEYQSQLFLVGWPK